MNLNAEVLIVLQPRCRCVRSVSTHHNTQKIIFIKCFLPLESNKFLASNLIFCRFKKHCYIILNCTTEKQNFVCFPVFCSSFVGAFEVLDQLSSLLRKMGQGHCA